MPFVNLTIISSPVYEKNQSYFINDLDLRTSKSTQQTIRSDHLGRLQFNINGSVHEIGINKKEDKPNIVLASVELTNMPWGNK